MASLTALELGTDTCALARTAARQEGVQVLAVEVLDPASYAGPDAFAQALREARRARKMPRRARVVLWGAREGATRHDAEVKPLLAPLKDAGFRVERVVSPCNALAALARVRAPRGEGATCWLAVNRAGVAIVVVRPGKQLYAHSFVWDSTIGALGSQARLLQRYSLVSYLAPQVQRAMMAARKQGTPITALVTCGNLPDLRSLTMPLIEELDLEVETLDSLEGLTVPPELAEQVSELAPAIRLACAATVARETRIWAGVQGRTTHRTSLLIAALTAALIAAIALGWWYYSRAGPI